jgi:tetratricopeptide (TPR) repeat protein
VLSYLIITFFTICLGLLFFRAKLLSSYFTNPKTKQLLEKAQQALSLKDWEQAKFTLEKLLSINPYLSETLVLYSKYFRLTKRPLEAYEKAIQAYNKCPEKGFVCLEFGKTIFDLGDSKKSLNIFKKHKLLLTSCEDLTYYSEILLSQNYSDEAWLIIKKLLKSSPSSQIYTLSGEYHFNKECFGQALQFFRKALSTGKDDYHLQLRVGQCLKRIGFMEDAISQLQHILYCDPKNLLATLELGHCFELGNSHKQALLLYQRPQVWSLGDPHILRQAGSCALKLRQYHHAQLYFQEAIKKGLSSIKNLALLGFSFECQECWEEAEETYFQLIEQFPQHPAGYRGLAWLYGVGFSVHLEPKDGLFMAQQAVKILPDVTSWELLSACEARAGNFTKAHQIQEKLSQKSNDKQQQKRCRKAMRALRKKMPLDTRFVSRILVA